MSLFSYSDVDSLSYVDVGSEFFVLFVDLGDVFLECGIHKVDGVYRLMSSFFVLLSINCDLSFDV